MIPVLARIFCIKYEGVFDQRPTAVVGAGRNNKHDVDIDWAAEAKAILKAEIARRRLRYSDVVAALEAIGIQETEANFRNKISRGTFTAAFFLQCLAAIGCDEIRLLP